MYLFGRDVAYLISLKMVNLNNRKINRKGGVFMGDSSTGHAQFEFSKKKVCTNSHGRLLTANRCFSHCIELIMENHTDNVNLTCKKVASRFFGAIQLSRIMILSCI